MATTPEHVGLIGCWQVVAVWRETIPLATPQAVPREEIAYYTCSIATQDISPDALGEAVRGHWSGSENGIHHRRDVSFLEDKCRVRDRKAAENLATLRNLAIGAFELGRAAGRTDAETLPSWCRQQTFTSALQTLRR